MQRSSVDLPEPDLPSNARISPSRTSRSMPSSTGSGPSSPSKDLVTPRTVMMGSGATAEADSARAALAAETSGSGPSVTPEVKWDMSTLRFS